LLESKTSQIPAEVRKNLSFALKRRSGIVDVFYLQSHSL